MHSRLDTHIGKVVRGIKALFVLTANYKVLEYAVACKSLCACRITYLVESIIDLMFF